jgi:outer membrane protein insertion porin family
MVSSREHVTRLRILIALAACAAPAVARADRGAPTPIVVSGNQAITSDELGAILIDALGRTTPPFDPGLVSRAVLVVQGAYWDRGYANARVPDPTVDPGSGALTFTITEGPRFTMTAVRVEGELLGSSAENLARIRTRAGMVFSRTMIAGDRETLARFYQDAGYAFVDVSPVTKVDSDHATIALVFQVTRGAPARFGHIRFDGRDSATLPPGLSIRQALTISPGMPYSMAALVTSQQHLQALGYRVEIATKTGSAKDLVDVELELHAR